MCGKDKRFTVSTKSRSESPSHPRWNFPLNGSAVVAVEDDDCHDDADGSDGHYCSEVDAWHGEEEKKT